MTIYQWLPILISIVAVIVAVWQGFLAKSQLEQAKNTKNDTQKLLDEINIKVSRVESISDETRKDVKDQISKLIDKQDENFKVLLNIPKENSQNEMIQALFPKIMENPSVLQTLLDLKNKNS